MSEAPKPESEPERAEVLPGLHYASIRHAAELGPSPCAQKIDSDWGVTEGFHIPPHTTRKTESLEAFDKQFKNSFTDDAPGIADLKNALIMRCRQTHAEDVAKRRACPKRKKVEEDIRKSAEDV